MTSNSKTDSTSDNLTATSSLLPRAKLTALARLKSFSGSFISSRNTPAPIVFPPPSWELSDELLGNNKPFSPPALLESNFADPVRVETPEAVPFAKRLRALIESIPVGLGGSSSSSIQSASTESENSSDNGKQGSPIPPGMDDGLVRMLSSEDVMNGKSSASATNESEEVRPGIWNILASLKGDNGKEESPRPSAVEEEEGGFMMYAPLEPKNDSQLELAESETILEYVDEPTSSHDSQKSDSATKQTTVEKHVWVPSSTELSILTTWWGYRIYLPPPVMAKLDGSSMKATARAAMITTALKWMLDKIPILLVPAQFRPAVKLLKQLGPLVGYVGVFISWSWDRVRSHDKGNGVVLTATWLLPVALLPMSWDAGDIQGPRPPLTTEATQAAAATATFENPPVTDEEALSTPKNGSKDTKKSKSFFQWR